MLRNRIIYLQLIMTLLYVFPLLSFNTSEKILKISKFEKKPKIDGKIDDDCWKGLKAANGFTQFDPINGIPASEETLAWSGYDSENIYFAFSLKDSAPDKIYGELCPRNQYFNNDEITVILDTYNDERTAIQFSLNSKGIQKTKNYYALGLSRFIDIVWKGEAYITPDGWTAEIAIPLKSLRFKEKGLQSWRVNFKRYIQRLKETDYWTPIKRDEKLLTKSGKLVGLEKIHPNHNIELFPYVGYRYSKWQEEIDKKFAAGLDFKYGISSNLILDMTVSPDFSEVESDPFIYQLSPYEVQYSENRPFFQEGSQYFRSNFTTMMYSKRINNPKFALKLTGKQKGYSIGFLEVLNNNDGDPDSLFSVIRIKKDIFRNSELGVFITGFNQNSDWNVNGSIDYDLNLSDIYSFSGQAGFSLNKNNQNGQNGIYYFSFSRNPDNGIIGKISYERVDPDVNVKTGIVSQIDYQAMNPFIGYSFRFNSKIVKAMNICLGGNYKADCSGTPTARYMSVTSDITLGDNANLYLGYYNGDTKKQIFDNKNDLQWSSDFFNYRSVILSYSFYGGRFFSEYGLEIDLSRTPIYTDNTYTDLTNGKDLELIGFLALQPFSNIKLSLNLDYISQKRASDGLKVFSGITMESSLLYQLTKKLFANLHYTGESAYKQYSLDILFGYDFGNGDLVQLGYKKSILKGDTSERGYSIFLKISYLFRI